MYQEVLRVSLDLALLVMVATFIASSFCLMRSSQLNVECGDPLYKAIAHLMVGDMVSNANERARYDVIAKRRDFWFKLSKTFMWATACSVVVIVLLFVLTFLSM